MRRIMIELPSDPKDAYAEILRAIVGSFGLTSAQASALESALKYKDEEGDLCCLLPATFEDFLSVSVGGPLRVFVEALHADSTSHGKQGAEHRACHTASQSQQDSECGHGQATTADMNVDGHPPCLEQVTQNSTEGCELRGLPLAQVMASFLSGMLSGDSVAATLLHFAQTFASQLDTFHEAFDHIAASHAEISLAIVRTLREGIEPFPQFSEVQISLDKILQASQFSGLSLTLAGFLRKLSELPRDQQQSVASVVLGGVAEKVTQLIPEIAPLVSCVSGDQPPVHARIVCDACGASPIVGPRFKCTTCADYDLCGRCYLQKEELHPGHTFECHTKPIAVECPMGWHKGWGRGWHGFCGGMFGGGGFAKGKGKGWGKGKCKGKLAWLEAHRRHHHHDPSQVQAENSSPKHAESSSSMSSSTSTSSTDDEHKNSKVQRRAAKKAAHAAKQAWRKARKEAKKNYKAQMKVAKQAWKLEKKALKLQGKAHKESGCASSTPLPGSMQMDSPTAPSAPPVPEKSPLQVLVEMGLENIELNMQLLEHHGGNVQAVLEVLLGGGEGM